MDGLKPGRIVYFVFDEQSAAEVNRRRTSPQSIAERITQQVLTPDQTAEQLPKTVPQWPLGAQAHIGNEAKAGDISPAMVLRVHGSSGCSNLKVFLDGSDDFWATSVNFDAGTDTEDMPNTSAAEKSYQPRTWHWMFDGQQKRYDPTVAR